MSDRLSRRVALAATALTFCLPQAAVSQTVPRLSASEPGAVTAWVRKHIEQEDWTKVGWAGWTVTFVSTLPLQAAPSALIQDWVRVEHGDAGNHGSLSGLARVEVDCRTLRSRMVEHYYYPENNLRGEVIVSDTPTAPMVEAGSGTIRESYVTAICQGTK